MTLPGVEGGRLWRRLMEMAENGATPGGGVDRQALSKEEWHAWRKLIDWAAESGVQPFIDDAGNLFLRLRGEAGGELAPILVGSHLDSQPRGGRFDGVYGVLAAVEVLETLSSQMPKRSRDVIAVAWMNEEGSRFAPGMMGSEAFVGARGLEEIRQVRDATGISVGAALDEQFAAFPDIPRIAPGFAVHAYVEPHIEQGPLLERERLTIGTVTGIQGKRTYRIAVLGEQGHAGTQVMRERRDALAVFARLACLLHEEIGGYDAEVKFTIGWILVEPNAPSVVPERVTFSIDLRHPCNRTLALLGARLVALMKDAALPCAVSVEPLVDAPSNVFDPALQQLIAASAARRGYPSTCLLSAAGHDARHLAKHCPAAMIFIPCRDGVSHAEHEWAEPEHVTAGANVLLDTVVALLTSPEVAGLSNVTANPRSLS